MKVQSNTDAGPDYSVQIDAEEIRKDLAAKAAAKARKADEHRQECRDYCPSNALELAPGELCQYQRWALEEFAAARAYARALLRLQPRPDLSYTPDDVTDGAVDVRSFMRWLKNRCEDTNDRRHGDYQTSAAHSAYADVLSLLRDEYGVGWPRFDDLGGVLEEDLP